MWRQRARKKWELEGDKGTRYFHALASIAKNQNSVAEIEYQGATYSDKA